MEELRHDHEEGAAKAADFRTDDDVVFPHALQQFAQTTLIHLFGAADGLADPFVHLQVVFLAKSFDFVALVLDRLAIGAYANISVYHFCTEDTKSTDTTCQPNPARVLLTDACRAYLCLKKRSMELQEFIKSHFAQDLSHWLIILFVCFLLPVFAALFDLWTGVDAAKANKERISSHALRRTVSKIVDYLRVIIFGLFIDVLGLFFSWYLLPYCVIICTLGILLIEGKSVIENLRRKKSHAAEVLDMVEEIIRAASKQDAERIIKRLKEKEEKI